MNATHRCKHPYRLYQAYLWLGSIAFCFWTSSRENLVEALHNSVLRATPCDPAEMLAFTVAILTWTGGDPAEAIPLAVNAGRDNDSVAGVVGMIAGTLHGVDAFPDRWVQTVEEANPTPDLRELAGNLCDAIQA